MMFTTSCTNEIQHKEDVEDRSDSLRRLRASCSFQFINIVLNIVSSRRLSSDQKISTVANVTNNRWSTVHGTFASRATVCSEALLSDVSCDLPTSRSGVSLSSVSLSFYIRPGTADWTLSRPDD